MNFKNIRDRILIISLYVSCGVLVIAYVNMYGLFTYLNKSLGSAFIARAPLILPLFIAALLILYFLMLRKKEVLLKWQYLLPGTLFLAAALTFPDPEIPVKRIHVTQYALLTVLVRYTMSYRLRGTELMIYSILFSAILGIHDEFLQGIHAKRTYGVRDMAVNGFSAIGSGMVLHGLGLFDNSTGSEEKKRTKRVYLMYLIVLALSLSALAIPLVGYLGKPMPVWPFLPLSATFVYWSCFILYQGTDSSESSAHGLMAISTIAFLFLLYPIIVNGLQVTFR